MVGGEELRRMRELRANGYSLSEIAREFNLSISTVYEYVHDVKYKSRQGRRQGQRLGDEDIARIIELRKMGKSISEIARELNIHYLTARKYIKLIGGDVNGVASQ